MPKITGLTQVRAVLKQMPEQLRAEATKPVRETTERMKRRVMELLDSAAIYAPFWHGGPGMQDVDTKLHPAGTARRSYRRSISRDGLTGRVGQLSPQAARDGFHLRFFFDGTVHQPARPAHSEVFESERGPFIIDQKLALQRALAALK
jgi:hypothetical protein